MKVLLSLCFSSSIDTNVRTRRSKTSGNQSRRQGCSLGTCTVHDLAHRLHQLSNKYKIGNAPVEKISPQGYGRRRRSLPERRVTLRLEQGRLRPVWSRAASPVHTLEALLRRTWAELGGDRKEGRRVTQSKILQMHLTSTEHCPEHFSRHEDWVRVRLDALKVCSSAESHGSAQWCQRGREAPDSRSLDGKVQRKLQMLLSAQWREKGDSLRKKRTRPLSSRGDSPLLSSKPRLW